MFFLLFPLSEPYYDVPDGEENISKLTVKRFMRNLTVMKMMPIKWTRMMMMTTRTRTTRLTIV